MVCERSRAISRSDPHSFPTVSFLYNSELGLQDEKSGKFIPKKFDPNAPKEKEDTNKPVIKYKTQDKALEEAGVAKELDLAWDLNVADDVTFGRKLGEGMSAEVFLATYRGKEVAIKKIFFTSPDDDAIVDFHNEAKLMRQLKHQYVIAMLGCTVARPFAYIVTEFMHKGSMYDMYTGDYNNNPPPWKVRVVSWSR